MAISSEFIGGSGVLLRAGSLLLLIGRTLLGFSASLSADGNVVWAADEVLVSNRSPIGRPSDPTYVTVNPQQLVRSKKTLFV